MVEWCFETGVVELVTHWVHYTLSLTTRQTQRYPIKQPEGEGTKNRKRSRSYFVH